MTSPANTDAMEDCNEADGGADTFCNWPNKPAWERAEDYNIGKRTANDWHITFNKVR